MIVDEIEGRIRLKDNTESGLNNILEQIEQAVDAIEKWIANIKGSINCG